MLAYCHVALPDDQSIRLLVLEPGQGSEPLHGSLEVVNIDKATNYEPVSYKWGDPSRLEKISLGGYEFGIINSVHSALLRLRLPSKQRRLWVDQICVDQDNLQERSEQVKFMSRIYENADHVLVWLGVDEENMAEKAFGHIHHLKEMFENKEERDIFRTRYIDNLDHHSDEEWTALKAMTDLPWFTRAWIVQEAGTKAPATLFWGNSEIDWGETYAVCKELADFHHLRKKFNINTSKMKYIYRRFIEADRASRHANRFSFIYELHRGGHLQVTDPRDRVFALLGHYSIRNGQNLYLKSLQADYTKTREEVYVDVARRALMDDEDPLITLSAVQHASLPPEADALSTSACSPHRLPSWVPDWPTGASHMLGEPTVPHRASADKKAILDFDSTGNILHIHGLEIDKVEVCSEPLQRTESASCLISTTGPSPIECLWRDVCGNKGLFNLNDLYLNGDPMVLAYTQTLSNGCVAIWWRDQSHSEAKVEHPPYDQIDNAEWLAHGASYLLQTLGNRDLISPELQDFAIRTGKAPHFWSRAANGASSGRAFARTTRGYFVLGPKVMKAGDIICVLFGGKLPFCLRPCGDRFLFVGECYVHGLMKGEAVKSSVSHGMTERRFEIV